MTPQQTQPTPNPYAQYPAQSGISHEQMTSRAQAIENARRHIENVLPTQEVADPGKIDLFDDRVEPNGLLEARQVRRDEALVDAEALALSASQEVFDIERAIHLLQATATMTRNVVIARKGVVDSAGLADVVRPTDSKSNFGLTA